MLISLRLNDGSASLPCTLPPVGSSLEMSRQRRLDGDDIRLSWPDMLGDWPATDHDLSSEGPRPYIGVTGWVYRVDGQWYAYPAEYARPDREGPVTEAPNRYQSDV